MIFGSDFVRQSMIIYQVYPRSFFDSNNDGIGDLAGIEKKLSYIKSLGVDAIWISPFFKSPMKDFGYVVSDYRAVDPIFGNMDDFKQLMRSAKALDLGVLVDMVISHTSEEHAWFKQSRAKENGKDDWYLWADPKPDGSPPNNWVSVFGGPAWRWDAERRQYYFHSFFSSQPDLNMHNPQVQQQVLAEMKFWLDLGVAGFRFDACNHIFQDLELRSNPPREDSSAALHPYGFQVHVYDQGRPEMLPFLEKVRKLLDAYGAFSLAEVGGADPLKLMSDYTGPGRLHSAYSFAMMTPDSSAEHVKKVIARLEEGIRPPAAPCYALSNHDKPRVATRWQKGRDREQTAKEMLALLFAMRGDICLYQGEELGLPQADVQGPRRLPHADAVDQSCAWRLQRSGTLAAGRYLAPRAECRKPGRTLSLRAELCAKNDRAAQGASGTTPGQPAPARCAGRRACLRARMRRTKAALPVQHGCRIQARAAGARRGSDIEPECAIRSRLGGTGCQRLLLAAHPSRRLSGGLRSPGE